MGCRLLDGGPTCDDAKCRHRVRRPIQRTPRTLMGRPAIGLPRGTQLAVLFSGAPCVAKETNDSALATHDPSAAMCPPACIVHLSVSVVPQSMSRSRTCACASHAIKCRGRQCGAKRTRWLHTKVRQNRMRRPAPPHHPMLGCWRLCIFAVSMCIALLAASARPHLFVGSITSLRWSGSLISRLRFNIAKASFVLLVLGVSSSYCRCLPKANLPRKARGEAGRACVLAAPRHIPPPA